MSSYVQVPYSTLSAEALDGLIEEFITREGTDYGQREHSLDEKKASVLKLLKRGEVTILFDSSAESTTLVTRNELLRVQAEDQDS